MATAPVKSQPLHNFNFPFLKWGTHGGGGSSSSTAANDRRRSPESDSDQDRLRPTRVGSRSTRIHRLSFTPPPKPIIKQSHREEEEEEQEEEEEAEPLKQRKHEAGEEEEETSQRPWNLRPRKLVVETTAVVEKMSETAAPKSVRLRGLAENGGGGEKKEKRRFWIALSKEEIEEDIFVMTGSRPSRRPKKRPKNVQKQLDSVFPGLWLVGTTADAYRVADSPVKK